VTKEKGGGPLFSPKHREKKLPYANENPLDRRKKNRMPRKKKGGGGELRMFFDQKTNGGEKKEKISLQGRARGLRPSRGGKKKKRRGSREEKERGGKLQLYTTYLKQRRGGEGRGGGPSLIPT